MTYDAREKSLQDGRPHEGYEFSRFEETWRYTSSDRNVSIFFNTHTAAPISRTEIESAQELARSRITITVPRNLAIVDQFRIEPNTHTMIVRVFQQHDADSEPVVIYTGRVVACEIEDTSWAKLACEPTITALERIGLRRLIQKQCTHVLYGPECTVNQITHSVVGNIDAISGYDITISEVGAFPDGTFDGGYLRGIIETSFETYEMRFVVKQVGSVLTLMTPIFSGFGVGTPLRVFKGCDHTAGTCDTKFGNILNYGGFEYLVQKNPFGPAPIF